MLRSSIMTSPRTPTERRRRLRRARARGFSLTELMAVVVIMGVLAGIAISAFHRRALQSNVTNAKVIIKSIAAAEEHYRAENQVYLDVSANLGWYPSASIPKNQKTSFWRTAPDAGSDPLSTRWALLAPDIRQPVEFGFMANAGLPNTVPALATTKITLPANVAVEPWYLIQARADADGDGTPCFVAAASWGPEIISVDDGE
jgi:prepilin-type N-terminal cleavage/methylation domain-containing protein